MGLFFKSLKKEKKKDKSIELAKEFSCRVCPRNNLDIKSPKMKPTGSKKPLLYFCGESPGKTEDYEGEQFVGDSGIIIRNSIRIADIDADVIRWNNVLRCFSNNETPTPFEIACCKQSLFNDIEKTKPLIVMGFGNIPLKTFVDGNKISLWRGRFTPIKIGSHTCWYYPTFHPSFILRKRNPKFENEYDKCFDFDIKTVWEYLVNDYEEPEFIDKDFKDGIKFVLGNDPKDVITIDRQLGYFVSNSKHIGFDIETTDKKPYGKDSKIISIAISNGDYTFAFPLDHPKAWNYSDRVKILDSLFHTLYEFLSLNMEKIAHNLKFELEWLFHKYQTQEFLRENIWHDTMAQAYILDERTSKEEGMLNLDRCIFLNFGFNLKEISNIDTKKILSYPLEDMLMYNGLDAKWTQKLFLKQQKRLDKTLELRYNDLVDTAVTLAITQNYGINIDGKQVEDFSKKYSKKLESISKEIEKCKEVVEFKKKFKIFNPLSPDHVIIIFRDYLKLPQKKETKKAKNYSVDDEVLTYFAEKEKIPLAQHIMDYREFTKLKSTYVDNVKSNTIDGVLYVSYNPYYTSTGRFSSGKGE